MKAEDEKDISRTTSDEIQCAEDFGRHRDAIEAAETGQLLSPEAFLNFPSGSL
jgi:hypothetical protein